MSYFDLDNSNCGSIVMPSSSPLQGYMHYRSHPYLQTPTLQHSIKLGCPADLAGLTVLWGGVL